MDTSHSTAAPWGQVLVSATGKLSERVTVALSGTPVLFVLEAPEVGEVQDTLWIFAVSSADPTTYGL